MLIKIFAVLCFLLINGGIAYADHQGPERIVEGKYGIVLSIIPGDTVNSLSLRFFINDARTGKRVSDITAAVSIDDQDGVLVLTGQSVEVKDGAAELKYIFPMSGLFDVSLEFKKNGEDRTYRPEAWSVWVPGKDGVSIGSSYPIGFSELASMGLGVFAIALIIWSFITNRKKVA
ncbi:MAG: hypothetical protein A3B23_01335 [Candidatus Colwellbacteria bacterium RIFCSPLOWO2_01_FULL_48_10]|uniref:CopC domain-containing protein n=1 Tax=Candidatus Colwellbacteria bacterium RIFCSPLOWO2_01_FULL_48_10 TaxID=1797690 RepID=A0A1G1Z4L1_9BACT|nr:MAG: hypothetical protein A3B23_01335 [Candidatus Colwellbacteria bacterium RIFCSPLOWO2_01_FULL_48_10]